MNTCPRCLKELTYVNLFERYEHRSKLREDGEQEFDDSYHTGEFELDCIECPFCHGILFEGEEALYNGEMFIKGKPHEQ